MPSSPARTARLAMDGYAAGAMAERKRIADFAKRLEQISVGQDDQYAYGANDTIRQIVRFIDAGCTAKTVYQIVSIHRDPWSDKEFSTKEAALKYLWADPEVMQLGPVERDRIFRVEERVRILD